VLTTAEIAAMRDTLEDWLPSTCTIQTKTESTGAMGGPAVTWANTYTDVPCRVDPGGGDAETVRNFALEGVSFWVLNVAYDQVISVENRVVYDSVTYEVRGVIDNQSYNLNRQAAIVRAE
jgi:hypothetical protein